MIHAWKAMEDAGLTGRFYPAADRSIFAAGNTDTAVVPSLIPNRISYALDVKGPMNIMKLPVPQL
ncbi:hypothetical protein [Bacillus subtilis]|uniref:hypothetical protein n=1 Tax=Bacillus subtilis TaxID=1423 RepID=UPI002029DAD0|nr:hypothetical protein [Bacillus subtilis]